MRSPHWSRRTRPALVVAAAATLTAPLGLLVAPGAATAAPLAPTSLAPAADAGSAAVYIVQVAGEPLATAPGLKPAPGKKVVTGSNQAKAYRAGLARRHQQILAGVRGGAAVRDYGVTFNGFAARLTENQVTALAKRGDVVRVWKDEKREATTNRTPEFLGLSGAQGVWQKRFGGPKNAGAGMIIGVIDSGIWPENPAFAPLKNPKDQAIIDAKWNGICDGGTGPGKVTCNNKIIGARAYYSTSTVQPFEYKTPRGYNSHGTHTASTAAGDYGVKASNPGMDLGTISGMAPAARIAVYKALWATPDDRAQGSTADLVAAIDQAVADGVDVINYSISGSRDSVVSPDEVAFYHAAQAGVFVSASAGNEGDSIGATSVNHTSPWVATVAAGTTDRPVGKTVTLGDGTALKGSGIGSGVGPARFVDAADLALPGVDPTFAKQCYSDIDPDTAGLQPALDPAKAKGAIVLCWRGGNSRVDKSVAVKNAGGIGMVHANTTATQSINADFHVVPSIHINSTDGATAAAYIKSAGTNATATISATSNEPVRAPEVAGFSSNGPALAGGGDLLKPDIMAPGVDIVAAVSPMSSEGKNFDAMSGTSMAAPHLAGIAALVKAAHPTWSPMAVKSALMTTAYQTDNAGQPIQRTGENATPLDMGAGHVAPAKSFAPGLVYDSTPLDWTKYACGLGQAQAISEDGLCDRVGSIDPSDLNYPSIAIGDLAGTQTVTRTVTNVGTRPMTYTARVQQPTGVKVVVSPAKITVPAGKSKTFTVAFTRTAAQFDQYAFGALTWQGTDGTTVRSPLAIRPVALQAPAQVAGTGTDGSKQITIKAGVSGTYSAAVHGLAPDAVHTETTAKGKVSTTTVDIPAGTKLARFATYDADYAAGTDLDIVVKKDGKDVDTSAGPTAEEAVTLRAPEPGQYTVEVTHFAGPDSIELKTHSFVVAPGATGNLTVSPGSGPATVGERYPVTLAWHGLDAAHHWLGLVEAKNNGSSDIGSTIVDIRP